MGNLNTLFIINLTSACPNLIPFLRICITKWIASIASPGLQRKGGKLDTVTVIYTMLRKYCHAASSVVI